MEAHAIKILNVLINTAQTIGQFQLPRGMKRMTFNPIKPEEKERLSIREHLTLVKGICKKLKIALSQLTHDIQKSSFTRFKSTISFPPLSNSQK